MTHLVNHRFRCACQKPTKMQAQLLGSITLATSQHVITDCNVPDSFLSKGSLYTEKRRLPAMCSGSGTKGPQTIRFMWDAGIGGSKKSRTKSSADWLTPKGLEAGDASLQQQQLASTGTAPLPPPGNSFSELSFTDHHLLLLGVIACAMTGALSCLLLATIPTLKSLKKAADSLGKLADAAREELPGTMAAVRLSGMEISDLTMELSDLGQEISAGVKSSSRAVHAAEDSFRSISTFTSIAVLQGKGSGQVEVVKPAVAHAARNTREALIQARSLVRSLITLTHLSSWFGRCWTFIRPQRQRARPSQSR